MMMVCGEALFDVFRGAADQAILNMQAVQGGSPYNVAIGLARLGSDVGFFGGLSNDPLGAILRQALDAEGVRTDQAPVVAANTTLALVQLDASGLPRYAFYGEGCADRQLHLDDLPVVADDVRLLHFGSFSLVVEPAGPTLRTFAQNQSGRRLISYDPNVRPTVVADLDLWRASLKSWLRVADIVKVSHEDLSLLFPSANPLEIVRSWLEDAPSIVVLTQGEDGATGFCRKGTVHVPATVIKTVDTVGAGDSFQAALLNGLDENRLLTKDALNELDLSVFEQILQRAVRASGITCTKKGADLPYARDII